MYALTRRWANRYLDYHKADGEARVAVSAWAVLAPVRDQYVVRPRDIRLVLNYLPQVGLRAVLTKIRSRLGEAERNEKFLSVGLGTVIEPARGGRHREGAEVAFLASNHPRCVDRISVDERMLIDWPGGGASVGDSIAFFDEGALAAPEALLAFAAWTPESGLPVDTAKVGGGLTEAAERLAGLLAKDPTGGTRLVVEAGRETRERSGVVGEVGGAGGMNAVLFGLGNYAKVVVLPYLDSRVRLRKIHEVDPLQLGAAERWKQEIDTSGVPREDEQYEVYFVAGFHHTHTPIASHALERGAYAVVEKPIATTREQLETLKSRVSDGPSRLFACFHKRYGKFNGWALEDLGVAEGEPVTFHCIVFEVPLPGRHWYNWPRAGSRILSNGCHWIDHFMHLNRYSPVRERHVREKGNGDLEVSASLENGAEFSMTLTDVGSSRLGLRELVELRAGNVTVRITDCRHYQAEDDRKILRRASVNPMLSYREMYGSISREIALGGPGDPPESLRSSELVIDLEEEVQKLRLRPPRTG
jgi:predicted dehydrogenase